MGDPELVRRAQAAAERLERSWDRWRRLRGLAAERPQPISSYVGYSLAEPWGRARVVFGVGAEEAEQLSALLEQDTGTDSRFSQGQLWEQAPSESGQTRPQPSTPPASGPRFGTGAASPASFMAAPVPANGAQPAADLDDKKADSDPVAQRPKNMPRFGSSQPASGTDAPKQGMADGIRADLAGWTSGELPGQASAGLAAWPHRERLA